MRENVRIDEEWRTLSRRQRSSAIALAKCCKTSLLFVWFKLETVERDVNEVIESVKCERVIEELFGWSATRKINWRAWPSIEHNIPNCSFSKGRRAMIRSVPFDLCTFIYHHKTMNRCQINFECHSIGSMQRVYRIYSISLREFSTCSRVIWWSEEEHGVVAKGEKPFFPTHFDTIGEKKESQMGSFAG